MKITNFVFMISFIFLIVGLFSCQNITDVACHPTQDGFELEDKLEIDSLRLNRKERINFFVSKLEESCLPDSSLIVVQFVLEQTGELSKFTVIKDLLPDQQANENTVNCLKDISNELGLNLGELKEIPSAKGGLTKVQYTIPLKGDRKAR